MALHTLTFHFMLYWLGLSVFFLSLSLSGRLKRCPPGSTRVATCPSAVVAVATSPPATWACAAPSSWWCQTGFGILLNCPAMPPRPCALQLVETPPESHVLHTFVFIMSRGAGSSLRVSILACKQARKLGLRGGERPAGPQPVFILA